MTKSQGKVAALFVAGRSIYQYLPGVEAYDARRDARTFDATMPAVAHPPCRHWSRRLAHQARQTKRLEEMRLGTWAVRTVRKVGGIIEQPAGSRLWKAMCLPMPNGPADKQGGWSLYVEQRWWGYVSRKPTWLYIVGADKTELPPIPMRMDAAKGSQAKSQAQKSRTMPAFAAWLIEAARACQKTRST